MENEYIIPANYTDAGKLLGAFEIRRNSSNDLSCIPVIAKPPSVKQGADTRTTVPVSPKGESFNKIKASGTHSKTASAALRISNAPNSFPASV